MSILILIFILIIFGALLNFSNRMTLIRGKKTYWILGIYVTVLIGSTLFYVTTIENDQQNASQLSTEHLPNLEKIAYENKSLNSIASFLVKEEQFNYDYDELTIQLNDPSYTYVPVLIKRNNEKNRSINASVYQIPTVIEGVDVSHNINPIDLSLTNQVMTLTMDDIYINLNVSKHEFPFRQFTGEQIFYDETPPLSKPNQLIYITIPEHIKLNVDENVIVHYRN